MHISEGVLSPGALATGWAVASAGIAVGLRGMDHRRIVRASLLSSAFFLASLVNVRIGPASAHLSLIAPVGIVLGWAAFPAVMAALLLQALLLGFGGLTTLGPNVAVMGGAATIVGLLSARAIRTRGSRAAAITASVAGACGVLVGAMGVAAFLWISDRGFLEAAKILLVAHVPVAIVEAIVTASLIVWLRRAAPELLSSEER